jgi:hypothetical protein
MRRRDIRQQNRELVTAKAGQGRVRCQEGREPPTDRDEELVARGVAEAVVDPLEPVEVEEENGERSAKRMRLGRPVTASWVAWYASRPSNALRSVRSTETPTMPISRPSAP